VRQSLLRYTKKLGALALAGALGIVASATMVAAPAEAASGCAINYKIVAVSIKYKGCVQTIGAVRSVDVYGLRLNDHGSPVTVSYQFALRDLTSGTVSYGGTWFTQTWAAGSGTISNSETFGCVEGHTIRGLLHVKYKGVTGAWSESTSITCPW